MNETLQDIILEMREYLNCIGTGERIEEYVIEDFINRIEVINKKFGNNLCNCEDDKIK